MINEDKPRKGTFEVVVNKTKTVISLVGMARPFTALKNTDIDALAVQVIEALKDNTTTKSDESDTTETKTDHENKNIQEKENGVQEESKSTAKKRATNNKRKKQDNDEKQNDIVANESAETAASTSNPPAKKKRQTRQVVVATANDTSTTETQPVRRSGRSKKEN